jgi:hypothetical protein
MRYITPNREGMARENEQKRTSCALFIIRLSNAEF